MIGPRRLRSQLTLSVALLVAVTVALAGLAIAVRSEQQDHDQLDRQLEARAAKIALDAGKANDRDALLANGDKPDGARNDIDLLAGTDAVTRVLVDGQLVTQRGEGIASAAPVATEPGFSTVTIDGSAWRSLVLSIDALPGGRLQVLQSLAPVEQRFHDNARLIAIVAVSAALLSALAAWVLGDILLRPLERLRRAAASIGPGRTDDGQRMANVGGQLEIQELAVTLATMLERLHASMEATRRFTADAGHELRTPLTGLGMDLETLRRNPELPATQSAEILDAMAEQHARIVALLDGLQHLARGDAGALPRQSDIDLEELLASAVAAAQRRHPDVAFTATESSTPPIAGWPDGIRLALDNLLENAALHGRLAGSVQIALTATPNSVVVVVDDDGQGIPDADRTRLTERFTRGSHTRSPGSGLGLAIVVQQARLHGGALTLERAPSGGLRAVLAIPS